jgi:hypothetical protein
MDHQNAPAMVTTDQAPAGPKQLGWKFWGLWVSALAVVGALSYLMAAQVPLAEVTLPPGALLLFGFLGGAVQGFTLRQQMSPGRWWILASTLAGFAAAWVGVMTAMLAETSAGLLAGWAYAWAVYGALFGVLLQRMFRDGWLMLTMAAGWAMAGIVSGAVGWALDVVRVTETIPTAAFFDLPSRTWSMAGLTVVGAVCGATGGAITGAALVFLSRGPDRAQDSGVSKATNTRFVYVVGGISGLVAAVLCIYLAPLVVTKLTEGSLDSLDLTIYAFSALASTPLCLPTIAVVAIPLAVGCGYVGLEIARASGRQDPRPWILLGAAIGGVAGYLLGSLAAFAIGYR